MKKNDKQIPSVPIIHFDIGKAAGGDEKYGEYVKKAFNMVSLTIQSVDAIEGTATYVLSNGAGEKIVFRMDVLNAVYYNVSTMISATLTEAAELEKKAKEDAEKKAAEKKQN